ncbi:MAG: hypothetical protein KGM17_12050 [Sphingomonadales bacterium]|nr:hypothetical protein [Sphingomonadales bacterium]
MREELKKLARLQRLERVRAIAKQTAAAEAAHAESTLAQLQALAARTGNLAADYAARSDARDGGDLVRLAKFSGGLQGVRSRTLADAARAQQVADMRQAELAQAERRRAAVEDRAVAHARELAGKAQAPVLGARKAIGTDLE